MTTHFDVVPPKPLREQFNLLPGDKLRLSLEGNDFRLEPTDAGRGLVRKGSALNRKYGYCAICCSVLRRVWYES